MSERGWANRVHSACQAFVEDAQRNVKSSRLVLIEGLGLGSKSRERLMRSALAFERVLADGFRRGARRGAAPTARAQSDRRRRAPHDLRAAADRSCGGAADADRRTARLGQRLPLARGADRGGAHRRRRTGRPSRRASWKARRNAPACSARWCTSRWTRATTG